MYHVEDIQEQTSKCVHFIPLYMTTIIRPAVRASEYTVHVVESRYTVKFETKQLLTLHWGRHLNRGYLMEHKFAEHFKCTCVEVGLHRTCINDVYNSLLFMKQYVCYARMYYELTNRCECKLILEHVITLHFTILSIAICHRQITNRIQWKIASIHRPRLRLG